MGVFDPPKDSKGHIWMTIGEGEDEYLDIFAYEEGAYHNGPRCKVCGYGFCHHCMKEPAIECPGKLMEEMK